MVVEALRIRFGTPGLLISIITAILAGVLLFITPLQPWLITLIPRIVLAVLFVLALNLAIFLAQLTLDKTRPGVGVAESSPMLWPQPVYEHLFRTRMPRELKQKIADNRREEEEAVNSFIEGSSRLQVISGPPGTGKSSMAALVTRRVDFWLNLHHRNYRLRDILYHLASWLEKPYIADQLLRTERISTALIFNIITEIAQGKKRLIFNGFDHLLDPSGEFRDVRLREFFTKLISQEGEHKIIVTAREFPAYCREEPVMAHGVSFLELQELAVESMIRYIQEQYESDDDELVHSIAAAAEGNPLLLEILLPRLTRPDSRQLLQETPWKTEKPMLIEPGFLRELAGEEFNVLQKVALVPEPLTKSFINFMGDSGNSAKTLEEQNLLIWDGGMKRYYCHPAVIDVAFATLPQGSEERIRTYETVAEVMVQKARDFKAPEKWASISDCRLYLYALDIYLRTGRAGAAAQILFMLQPHLERWGHQLLLIRHYEQMLQTISSSPDSLYDVKLVMRISKALISLYLDSGSPDRAEKVALSLERFGLLERNKPMQLLARAKKLEALTEQKQFDAADALSVKLVQQTEGVQLAANLARRGHLLKAAGDLTGAVNSYTQSAGLFKRLGKETPLLKSIEYLAETYVLAGRYAEAHNLLEKLHKKELIKNDFERLFRVEHLRANAYIGLGDHGKAILILNVLCEKACSREKFSQEVSCQAALAHLYGEKQNLPAANEHLDKMAETSEQIGDLNNLGLARARQSRLFLQMGRLHEALEKAETARELFIRCQDQRLAEKAEDLIQTISSKAELS